MSDAIEITFIPKTAFAVNLLKKVEKRLIDFEYTRKCRCLESVESMDYRPNFLGFSYGESKRTYAEAYERLWDRNWSRPNWSEEIWLVDLKNALTSDIKTITIDTNSRYYKNLMD